MRLLFILLLARFCSRLGETGHKVIVDAGNGKVLDTSEGFPLSSFASSWKGHGQEQWHEFHGAWKPMFGGS